MPYTDPMEAVRKVIQRQSWFEEASKAVAGGVGVVVNLIWLSASFGFALPEWLTWGVTLVISLLTVFGIYQTPGGVTTSQFDKIQEMQSRGRHELD